MNASLDRFARRYAATQEPLNIDLQIDAKANGLHLSWHQPAAQRALVFHLDFVKTVQQLRSFPAPKQGAFNQALGNKTRRIIDATGGWGGDALLMCMQGYQVDIIERQPLMALLLSDAFERLERSDWAMNCAAKTPIVLQADAIPSLLTTKVQADCVFLDPMFPPKKKKSAAANKQMQLLHWLVGQDIDSQQLVDAAVQGGYPRVVVKRPDYAAPLRAKPDARFSSKLVHYDVYLN